MGPPILEFWEGLVKDLGTGLEVPLVRTVDVPRTRQWGRGREEGCSPGSSSARGQRMGGGLNPESDLGGEPRAVA